MLCAVLWKDDLRLSRKEVETLAERYGERVKHDGDVCVVKGEWTKYLRLARARYVGKWWGSFREWDDYPALARKSGLFRYTLRHQPFIVKTVPGGKQALAGWWLEGRVGKKAKTVVLVYRGAERYHVVAPAVKIRNEMFAPRNTKNRPFFHPASMNARDARLLVNLSGVLPGEKLWDPFCGAGGILLEGAEVGANVIGTDIDEKMADGARKNLRHYGHKGTVVVGDARTVDVGPVDAIVTDLPYGRSSRVPAKDVRMLYREAFENMFSHLKRGGRAVVVAPFDVSGLLEGAGFTVEGVYEKYVHSTLTRRIHVCHV